MLVIKTSILSDLHYLLQFFLFPTIFFKYAVGIVTRREDRGKKKNQTITKC